LHRGSKVHKGEQFTPELSWLSGRLTLLIVGVRGEKSGAIEREKSGEERIRILCVILSEVEGSPRSDSLSFCHSERSEESRLAEACAESESSREETLRGRN
jgi:hypothetical protein